MRSRSGRLVFGKAARLAVSSMRQLFSRDSFWHTVALEARLDLMFWVNGDAVSGMTTVGGPAFIKAAVKR